MYQSSFQYHYLTFCSAQAKTQRAIDNQPASNRNNTPAGSGAAALTGVGGDQKPSSMSTNSIGNSSSNVPGGASGSTNTTTDSTNGKEKSKKSKKSKSENRLSDSSDDDSESDSENSDSDSSESELN